MDFTVSSRALTLVGHVTSPANATSDLPRTLLRDPRSDIHHLHPGLDLALRLLQPMCDAAFRRAAFGLLLQRPVRSAHHPQA